MNEIDINELTVGQARQLAEMFGVAKRKTEPHPFVGRYVICRCYSAGVHAGELVSQDGDVAILKNSRRLWQWTANDGVALSGLSRHGLKWGKIDTNVPEIALTGVIETIPCSEKARDSINEA